EAIGQHPLSSMHCRGDHFDDVIGARGRKEQGLRPRPPTFVVTVEQQLADSFGSGAASWFAGHDAIDAAALQRLGQRPNLRRFADPLTALQRDEFSALWNFGAHAIPKS